MPGASVAQLLSGSVADNICCFDETFDVEWMQTCARMAGIHDEVMRMPMGYNSLIGDMGTFLSGGQKQRVVLARVLYRRPRILFRTVAHHIWTSPSKPK
jgi:ATP-binding cassette, subfamily B, bacterial CvaB/MchF/RaxB